MLGLTNQGLHGEEKLDQEDHLEGKPLEGVSCARRRAYSDLPSPMMVRW
jgi:hypothetical protein